jgi:hypothetical protein
MIYYSCFIYFGLFFYPINFKPILGRIAYTKMVYTTAVFSRQVESPAWLGRLSVKNFSPAPPFSHHSFVFYKQAGKSPVYRGSRKRNLPLEGKK